MNITVKTSLTFLKETAKSKPEGWLDSILRLSEFNGSELVTKNDKLIVEIYGQEWFNRVTNSHPEITTQRVAANPAQPPRPLPPEAIADPSLLTMSKSLGLSIWRWSKCGFKLAPDDVVKIRRDTCIKCPHWNPTGNAGLGKCEICGCSGIKHILPDEKCPAKPPRWEAA